MENNGISPPPHSPISTGISNHAPRTPSRRTVMCNNEHVNTHTHMHPWRIVNANESDAEIKTLPVHCSFVFVLFQAEMFRVIEIFIELSLSNNPLFLFGVFSMLSLMT